MLVKFFRGNNQLWKVKEYNQEEITTLLNSNFYTYYESEFEMKFEKEFSSFVEDDNTKYLLVFLKAIK